VKAAMTSATTGSSHASKGERHDTITRSGSGDSAAAVLSPSNSQGGQLDPCAPAGLSALTPQTRTLTGASACSTQADAGDSSCGCSKVARTSSLTTTTPQGRRIWSQQCATQRHTLRCMLDKVVDKQLVFAGRYLLTTEVAQGAQVRNLPSPEDGSGVPCTVNFRFVVMVASPGLHEIYWTCCTCSRHKL
jgi:hypothetical protein